MSWTERAAMVAIVLLACFLRLYQLDLIKFGHEEANALTIAAAWIDEGRFPLTGELGSTGVYPPAGTPYLMAPILLLARHPLVASVFVAMLNLLSIVILYRLVRRGFGHREAVLAALIYAAGFWPVYASRYIWDAAPIPAVAVLVLDRLVVAATQRRPTAGAWAMAWAIAGMTMHPSAVVLLVAALAVVIALRLPVRPGMLAPLLLSGLLWVPYAIYLVQGGFSELSAALAQAGQPARVDLDAVAVALWQLFPRPEDPILQTARGSVVPGGDWLQWLHPVTVVGFLAALAWCVRRGLPALRRPGQASSAHLVLALAYLVPVALHVAHSLPIRKHYLFPLLPYASVILAVGLVAAADGLIRRREPRSTRRPEVRGRAFRWALAAALLLALPQAWFLVALLHSLSENGATFGSGVPLRTRYEAMQAARALLPATSSAIHMATRRESGPVYSYLAPGVTTVDQERTLVFPSNGDQPLVYITVADRSKAGLLLRRHFPERERLQLFRTYALMQGEGGPGIAQSFPPAEQLATLRASPPDFYRAYLLPPDAGRGAQGAVTRFRGPWSLENGLVIEGYDLPEEIRPGADLPFTVAWTVAQAPAGEARNQEFFVHLLDRRGGKWGEANELDYDATRWRPGDRVISWLQVPVGSEAPPGLYSLQFGMFDAQSQDRIGISPRQPADSIATRSLRVVPSHPPQPPGHVLEPPIRFGSSLELLGYDLPAGVNAGAPLDLRLLWRAIQPMATNYTLFVHLLDQGGQLVAQEDGFPAGGLYPTSAWRSGEIVEDRRRVSLPPAAAGKRLTVALGWYVLDSGQRLPTDTSSSSDEAAFVLGSLVVGP